MISEQSVTKKLDQYTSDACDIERPERIGEKFRGTFGTGADD